jgi:hypothetical protein
MATNFPTSVDVFTNPIAGDSLNSPSHSAQHANANDAIEAIETYVLAQQDDIEAIETYVLAQQPTFRNVLINGEFNINQRAFTSTTTNGAYGFDRWALSTGANGTCTYSSQVFAVGNVIAGYEPTNYARMVTAGQTLSSAYSIFEQKIEDVRTLAGQTVTISFWAKASTGTPKVSIENTQYFGIGGSPSANVLTYGGQVTLSTSWTRYSVTYTIPSISGKTIGTTANTSFTTASLWTSGGSDYNARTGSIGIQNNTIEFWGIQLEKGTVATPLELLPIGTELALCQRYYYQTDTAPDIFGISFSANVGVFYQVFPVTMRITPAPVYPSTGLTNAVDEFGVATRTPTALAAAGINTNSDNFQCTGMSGVTAGRPLRYLGPVIAYNAEL